MVWITHSGFYYTFIIFMVFSVIDHKFWLKKLLSTENFFLYLTNALPKIHLTKLLLCMNEPDELMKHIVFVLVYVKRKTRFFLARTTTQCWPKFYNIISHWSHWYILTVVNGMWIFLWIVNLISRFLSLNIMLLKTFWTAASKQSKP